MRTALRWVGLALVAGLVLVLAVQLWYLGWIAWWKWNNPSETAFMAREEAALRAEEPEGRTQAPLGALRAASRSI